MKFSPPLSRSGRVMASATFLALLVATACQSSAKPTPEPSASPVLQVDSWRMIPAKQLTTDGSIFNPDLIVAAGPGFVAMGDNYDQTSSTVSSLQAWYSSDGETWQQSTSAAMRAPQGSNYRLSGLHSIDGLIVAVVSVDKGDLRGNAVWTSTDGVNWDSAEAVPFSPDDSGRRIQSSAVRGQVYALTGGDKIWRRTAASSRWEQVPLTVPNGCFTDETAESNDVGILIYGWCDDSTVAPTPPFSNEIPRRNYVLAVSGNGSLVSLDSKPSVDLPYGIASLPGTTVVVGYRSLGEDFVEGVWALTEDNGKSWSPARRFEVPGERQEGVGVERAMALSNLLLATGKYVNDGNVEAPAIWTSSDKGQTWAAHKLPVFNAQGWVDVAAESNGRIVVPARYGYSPKFTAGIFVNF